ncbi:MAG: hypothetical protein WBE91_10025 [Steroidobacteraceae bacterium]
MQSTTAATDPLSYYEVFSALWAAARAARGTNLRGEPLINFDVLSPVPHGFVAKLGSKLRPAGIEHGLRQAGSGKSVGIDVADTDAPVLLHYARGQVVQKMLATIRDLGVDSPHAGFVPSTLRNSKRSFVFTVWAWCFYLLACGECSQKLKPEIYSDLTDSMPRILQNLNLQIEVPAAARILGKTAAANLAAERSAEPQSISTPQKVYRVPIHANRTRCLEWNPAQGLPTTPSRPPPVRIARTRKLLADRLHGVRVQAQELATAGSEAAQIEARRPTLVVPARSLLDVPAVVPDSVHRQGLPLKKPTRGRILDPVPVGQHHGNTMIDSCQKSNTDAKHVVRTFTPDLPSEAPEICSVCRKTRAAGGERNASSRRSCMRPFCHQFGMASTTDTLPTICSQSAASG